MKLSIIIPTLNESQYLPATILSIREQAVLKEPHEIIVVDCSSTDNTANLALQLGVHLVRIEYNVTGRAFALNKGAEAATGDIFLFVDADTLPPKGYDEAIKTALEDSKVVGGAFEFALDGEGFGLRLVELINRLRYRISQLYYGDQGIFVRANIFRMIGGCPPRRILEAAHFCASLKQVGKLILIDKPMKTSPRRFLESGVYTVLAKDIKIWWLDLMGKPVDQYADTYWEENLRDKKKDQSPGSHIIKRG